ncbi:hypothetical protein JXO59_14415 [candidate division KSB1 bacterium]|nr:hypothetical protein [candidate division KSB1 bacterium]
MNKLNKYDSGWILAETWLSALEEAARDFHGSRPRSFCERAYRHATENYLRILENDYAITAKRMHSIRDAIEEYIRVGVLGGLFQDSSQFELREINPNRIEILVHQCPYRKTCERLMQEGSTLQDLTCARIGCFSAATHFLAGIDCNYEVTQIHETGCKGFIERR